MVAKIRMTLFNSDEMQKEQVWLLAKNAQFSIWELLPSKIGLMQSSDDWEMIKDKQRGWVDISDNYDKYLLSYHARPDLLATVWMRWQSYVHGEID